jgi:hypothetical protein
MLCWMGAKRDAESARTFLQDVHSRLDHLIQLTTDRLMSFSLMRGSCLQVGVLEPPSHKTERPPRHLPLIDAVTVSAARLGV